MGSHWISHLSVPKRSTYHWPEAPPLISPAHFWSVWPLIRGRIHDTVIAPACFIFLHAREVFVSSFGLLASSMLLWVLICERRRQENTKGLHRFEGVFGKSRPQTLSTLSTMSPRAFWDSKSPAVPPFWVWGLIRVEGLGSCIVIGEGLEFLVPCTCLSLWLALSSPWFWSLYWKGAMVLSPATDENSGLEGSFNTTQTLNPKP